MVLGLIRTVVLNEGATTGVQGMLDGISAIVTSLTAVMTSLTAWILADPLAIMFFSIMFLMLAIHIIHSLVHKFS